ncbi:mediator-associated protein 2 [Syzygium oleosum]|uniref:mediator-associated protein 2 n=1 Tax=Syzygium oleosum TaxID=219896 RepID=UPI0011D1F9E3|nr:mediator-associated protein 2 [Syzygium oleosum]
MGGGAGSGAGEGYVPPPEFVEDSKEALVDLDASDSTELWLIQWPTQMPPDLDGQELTLKLHRDGKLGSCEDSSGKEYDVVSYAAQEPDATVFVSSSSGPRFVGKISRRVSLVRYPDPNELKELRQLGPLSQTPSRTSVTNASSQFPHLTSNSILRSSRSSRGNTASTRSSRQKSGISYAGETSEPYKRRYPHESTDSLGLGNSTQDSGRGHGSAITAQFSEHSRDHGSAASSLSREHSDGKSKKKKKRIED